MNIINNVYVKTMEECGELVQACAKVVKYDTPEARHHLAEECGDVLAFIYLLQESGIVSEEVMQEKRKNTLLKYSGLLYGGGYKRDVF
mgnify:FL=1